MERTDYILVVDDDGGARATLRALLEDDGFEVIEVESGRRALEHLFVSARKPLLVLIEPTSGGELLAIMKCYTRLARVPVVLVDGQVGDAVDGPTLLGAVHHALRCPSAAAQPTFARVS